MTSEIINYVLKVLLNVLFLQVRCKTLISEDPPIVICTENHGELMAAAEPPHQLISISGRTADRIKGHQFNAFKKPTEHSAIISSLSVKTQDQEHVSNSKGTRQCHDISTTNGSTENSNCKYLTDKVMPPMAGKSSMCDIKIKDNSDITHESTSIGKKSTTPEAKHADDRAVSVVADKFDTPPKSKNDDSNFVSKILVNEQSLPDTVVVTNNFRSISFGAPVMLTESSQEDTKFRALSSSEASKSQINTTTAIKYPCSSPSVKNGNKKSGNDLVSTNSSSACLKSSTAFLSSSSADHYFKAQDNDVRNDSENSSLSTSSTVVTFSNVVESVSYNTESCISPATSYVPVASSSPFQKVASEIQKNDSSSTPPSLYTSEQTGRGSSVSSSSSAVPTSIPPSNATNTHIKSTHAHSELGTEGVHRRASLMTSDSFIGPNNANIKSTKR